MKREGFGSRIGFLLVSAGCAIGIGNVWKFPYVTGAGGGGVFVLFYLLFLIIMGVPILTMELALGRASRQSAVKAYRTLEPKGSYWHIHGYFCFFGCLMLMMYYTSVSGWMLDYFVKYLTGTFSSIPAAEISSVYSGMLGNAGEMMIYMAVTVVLGILICSLGIRKGVEKITTVMMTCLLGLIIILVVHSLTLSGAADGIRFYLLPDFARAKQAGIGNIITAAMNQSFFTLSLGVASIEIFGSYMPKDYTLGGEAVRICALDTFVALMSGLIIFPACFTYGVQPDSGPSLIFVTLPQVFRNMAAGRLWGTLFFLFMTFAALSTVVAVFENLIAGCIDNLGWDRKKASIVCFVVLLVTSIPCVLSFNAWSGVRVIGSMGIFESEDFIVSNLLLPLGSLVFLLFCVTEKGWGFANYLKETNTGSGLKLSAGLKRYFQFILPVLILVILITGLI